MSKRGAIWLVFVGATMLGFAFAAGRLSSSRLKVEIPSLNSPAGSQVVTDVAGFEPDIVELGDCDWNTTAPFEVRFVNPGRERVIIDAVKTSCGCTGIDSASYTGVPVEPGSNLVIKGKMEVGSKPGQQRQQVDVLLDSGLCIRRT